MNNNLQNTLISTPKILVQHGYQYLELIGEGANGKTYKAKSLKTGEIVAIKELKFSENLKNYELFEREAETLKSIHTPGTPKFYEYITGEKEFTECWLVQEYVEGESIFDKMENGTKYSEIQTLQLLLQTADVVCMLQTMYTPPIIHRDIKPSNILIRNEPVDGMTCCLIDFGAVANPQRRGVNSTVAGTVGYMAPEQLIGDCTIQSDYYALGATGLHMLTGIAPSNFDSDAFKLQFEDQLHKSVPKIHKETIELFRTLLAPNANDRPKNSFELIKLISDTLIEVDDCAVERKKLEKKVKTIEKYYSSNDSRVTPEGGCLLTLWTLFFAVVSAVLGMIADMISLSPVYFLISLCIIFGPYIWIIISARRLPGMHKRLKELPFYDALPSKEYVPQLSQKILDSDNSSKAVGTVQAVLGSIFEYTVTVEHKSFAAFCHQPTPPYKPYKIGDKVNLIYSKSGKKYTFEVDGNNV